MPVFGKERERRARGRFLEKEVLRNEAGTTHFAKRVYAPRKKYFSERSPVKHVERMLGFPIRLWINQKVEQLKRRPVILDWGCGSGETIKQISAQFGSQVKTYGYAKDSHKDWKEDSGTKFIHATANDLLRYIKNGAVDLIYSNLGLFHNAGPDYIVKLSKKLSAGGVLIFHACPFFEFSREGQDTRTVAASLGPNFDIAGFPKDPSKVGLLKITRLK